MLASLGIRDVVLIERLDLAFGAGLCALTGETGAGKSILLDSLGLALGGRAEAGLVRVGADQASVTAEFDIALDHPVFALLSAQGIEAGSPLILRRTLSPDGRSRAWIDDQPVSIGLLKQAGALLIEIHGQFDTQGLLDSAAHRGILDLYAGTDTGALAQGWEAWKAAQAALETARAAAEKAKADEEYLRGCLEDLKKLAPQEGEEEQLAALRVRLLSRRALVEGLNAASEALNGDDGADRMILQAQRVLGRLGDKGDAGAIEDIIAALDRASAEIRDCAAQIDSMAETDSDEGFTSIEQIEDRLYELRAQARRHGCAVTELHSLAQTLSCRLAAIERADADIASLAAASETARKTWLVASQSASALRKDAAAQLDTLVQKELAPLKLDRARFVTDIAPLDEPDWGPGGADRVRFLVATNPGTAPGPLGKIASGGEMARFMLALKVVLARTGSAGTLVFDEVDAGIGGATADAVGERLARLARSRQILVVTHSPQVAARADRHWIVVKTAGIKSVRTTVVPLDAPDRRKEEIARMLSGAEITDEARAAAGRLMGA